MQNPGRVLLRKETKRERRVTVQLSKKRDRDSIEFLFMYSGPKKKDNGCVDVSKSLHYATAVKLWFRRKTRIYQNFSFRIHCMWREKYYVLRPRSARNLRIWNSSLLRNILFCFPSIFFFTLAEWKFSQIFEGYKITNSPPYSLWGNSCMELQPQHYFKFLFLCWAQKSQLLHVPLKIWYYF